MPENIYGPDNAIDPERFFQNNYIAEYRHGNGLHGEILMNCDIDWCPFNFHLNYRDQSWHPLDDDGFLPRESSQCFAEFSDFS